MLTLPLCSDQSTAVHHPATRVFRHLRNFVDSRLNIIHNERHIHFTDDYPTLSDELRPGAVSFRTDLDRLGHRLLDCDLLYHLLRGHGRGNRAPLAGQRVVVEPEQKQL